MTEYYTLPELRKKYGVSEYCFGQWCKKGAITGWYICNDNRYRMIMVPKDFTVDTTVLAYNKNPKRIEALKALESFRILGQLKSKVLE